MKNKALFDKQYPLVKEVIILYSLILFLAIALPITIFWKVSSIKTETITNQVYVTNIIETTLSGKKLNDATRYLMEYAYFTGQKCYMTNDIRIKRINESNYIWIKSPWGDPTNMNYVQYTNLK